MTSPRLTEPTRIIPAYAGSTLEVARELNTRADHPRIRGEHDRREDSVGSGRGSSPHTRGALVGISSGFPQTGIIPAYAGSTRRSAISSCSPRDHPRIRGEHRKMRAMAGNLKGSSPHTRGAQVKLAGEDQPDRIIPAYAGSTRESRTSGNTTWDHPRIRGEHVIAVVLSLKIPGSSPHTRGARPEGIRTPVRARIIPAYAGSTPYPSERRRTMLDHPRIRGEHPVGA